MMITPIGDIYDTIVILKKLTFLFSNILKKVI